MRKIKAILLISLVIAAIVVIVGVSFALTGSVSFTNTGRIEYNITRNSLPIPP